MSVQHDSIVERGEQLAFSQEDQSQTHSSLTDIASEARHLIHASRTNTET